MAKKKNVVGKAKGLTGVILVFMTISGWAMSAYTVLIHNDVQKQGQLIDTARSYLEDQLYIRTVNGYKEALKSYHTDHNVVYQEELLDIYKEAGMWEAYYDLIEQRMQDGTAQLEEYRQLAQNYIDEKSMKRAIEVLQKGMELYDDEMLVSLYESIRYEYSPETTVYTEVHMPAKDWYIPAFDGTHWGYIGANGRMILDFAYEEATRFSGSYAVVKEDGRYILIDKQGYRNAVDKLALDQVTAIAGSRIVGVKDGAYGLYSNTFRPLTSETYDLAYLNDNGMIVVQKGGKWAILDSDLKEVTEYCFTDMAVNSKGQVFSGNYAVAADESGYYLIDQKGNPCFEQRFPGAKGIEEGLFAVSDSSGRWGFANGKGELVIECQYDDVYSFSSSLAAVKYAGKWGYINRYQTWVIEPQFAAAYPFIGSNALVMDERGNYRILSLKYYELFQ